MIFFRWRLIIFESLDLPFMCKCHFLRPISKQLLLLLFPLNIFQLLVQKQVLLIKLALEWQPIGHRIAKVVLALRTLFVDEVEGVDDSAENSHAVSK